MRNNYIYLSILLVGSVLILTVTLLVSKPLTTEEASSAQTKITVSKTTQIASTNPIFTTSEVTQHNTKQDCYVIVNNEVYDITSYFGKHPAGNKIMMPHCGKETSKVFAAVHSNFAWNLLEDYYIGDLEN